MSGFNVNQSSITKKTMNQSTLKTDLINDWQNPNRAISEIITDSDLALTPTLNSFSDHVYRNSHSSVFVWDFGNGGNAKVFFKALANHLLGDRLVIEDFSEQEFLLVFAAIKKRPLTIFLAGVESLQNLDGDDYGLLKDREFCTWLKAIANLETKAFVVVVSKIPVFDLINFSSFSHYQ